MRKSATWVLITDGMEARVCSTADGLTTPLPMPPLSLDRQRHSKRLFAHSLAQFLHDARRAGAYGRLIIIATPLIAEALDEALLPETREFLIGKIVRDTDYHGFPETHSSELRH